MLFRMLESALTIFLLGNNHAWTIGVKLPKIIVVVMTKTKVEDTITLLNLKLSSGKFSTRPNAMAPLIKAA